jgi:hypothetical protein
MPAKTRRRAAARRPAKRKVSVRVTYHHRPAVRALHADRHYHAKRVLAYTVFAVALAIGITAFYDAAYYTGMVVLPTGTNYIMAVSDGSGGTGSSTNYKMAVSTGEASTGTGTSTSYSLTLGAMAFLGGDATVPTCTISQSTGTPAEGAEVSLTASCSDDTALQEIAFHTDESGTMAKSAATGAVIATTDATKTVGFAWKNAAVKSGTTVTWKIVATDSSGNTGESSTLAFTVGAAPDSTKPTAGKPTVAPTSPMVGSESAVTAALTDDNALASASLKVNGNPVSTATVTGKTATASFKWTPATAGTYSLTVVATDGAGNTAESDALVVSAITGECKAEKPADVLGDCNNGFQTKSTYVCDAATGTWKAMQAEQACNAPTPIAFIAVGVVALAIALGAALYILKNKKAAVKGKTPAAPATFG